MLAWFTDAEPLTHILAALLLAGRLGDVVSTRLASPKLRLEANPLGRLLGWRFIYASLLLALVPYYSAPLGVACISVSFLVTASNLSRVWLLRTVGEHEYELFLLDVARRGRRRTALAFLYSSALVTCSAGVLLMWLSGPTAWGYYFGFGIVVYGMAVAVHGSFFLVRLFRRAKQSVPAV